MMKIRPLFVFTAAASLAVVVSTASRSLSAQQQVVGGSGPRISPDGRHVIFSSNRDGANRDYVIGADGKGERPIPALPPRARANWSPDGKGIWLATLSRGNDTSYIQRGDLDGHISAVVATLHGRAAVLSPDNARKWAYTLGGWTANVVMIAGLAGDGAHAITDSSTIRWNIAWSPDGKQIAYTGNDATRSGLAVFVMNADGSGVRQVTHFGDGEGNPQLPAWSPDGTRLAVQSSPRKGEQPGGYIWIVDVPTGHATRIAHAGTYLDEIPAWFPDGKRIALQSDRTGRMEVWTMNADGTDQRQLTSQ